jgi:hypothetical protein
MWNLVSVHSGTVLVLEQDRCTVCTKPTIGSKIVFRRTRWYSYVTRLKWKLVLIYLEIVLNLMQGRCIVYAECTIGLAIILDANDGTPS